MYRRVLLAYDGSREGRLALREGAIVAHRFACRVYLLCIVSETPGSRLGEGAHAGSIALAQDSYSVLFEEAMTRLRGVGFQPDGRIVTGEPVTVISACAREIDADLVVVGHRRRSLLERWWSGTTGAHLLDHLECSLLIARRKISDEEFEAVMAHPRGEG